MIISLPAPEDPPMMQAPKLGAMAMHLVSRFLNQIFIFRSRNPCKAIVKLPLLPVSGFVLIYYAFRVLDRHTCIMYWPA